MKIKCSCRFYNKEHENLDPISHDNISSVEAWVTEKEIHSDEIDRSDWMTVDPPIGNVMVLGPEIDDIEALGEGRFYYHSNICWFR